MYKLRKVHPPYGTEITPIWEFAYSEQVRVVNGLCEVKLAITRDFLLNMGYELVAEEIPAPAPPVERTEFTTMKGNPKPRPKKR